MSVPSAILITRPRAEAEIFAHELKALGYKTRIQPLLEIVPVDFDVPDLAQYQGLVFTSANALRIFSGSAALRDIPVFVVGAQTKRQAENLGYNEIICAEGGGEELAKLIVKIAAGQDKRLLHIRGAHVAFPVQEKLIGLGIPTDKVIVYEAHTITDFNKEILKNFAEHQIDAVTFFSARTARHFMELAMKNGLFERLKGIKALSISASVLECVRSAPWRETYAAAQPERQGMIDLIRRVCIKQK